MVEFEIASSYGPSTLDGSGSRKTWINPEAITHVVGYGSLEEATIYFVNEGFISVRGTGEEVVQKLDPEETMTMGFGVDRG